MRDRNEIANELTQNLGPEYISFKPGGGYPYIENHRLIDLANEIFGYDAFSCQIKSLEKDFVHVTKEGRVSMSAHCIARVQLSVGAFHEDIGSGSCQNMPSFPVAYDKVVKEAATDAFKRCLRHFGRALGNCLYDKEYCKAVKSMNSLKREFREDQLRRPKWAFPELAPQVTNEDDLNKSRYAANINNHELEIIPKEENEEMLAPPNSDDFDLLDDLSEAHLPIAEGTPIAGNNENDGEDTSLFVAASDAEVYQKANSPGEVPATAKYDFQAKLSYDTSLPQDRSGRVIRGGSQPNLRISS